MDKQKIKSLVEEILNKIGIVFEKVEWMDADTNRAVLNIFTKDSSLLIGPQGETLRSLNSLVRRMVSKGEAEDPKFSIDVNGYRSESVKGIERTAKVMADRAISFKTSIELEPMSSYERMVIHSLFADHPNIITESTGVGKDRRVIIKYTDSKVYTPDKSDDVLEGKY